MSETVAQFIDRAIASESISWQARGVQYVYRLWLSETDARPLTRHERNYLVACLMGPNAKATRVPGVGHHGRRGYVARTHGGTR